MDIRYGENTLIHVVKASYADDAPDLVALGGDNFVNVLQVVREPGAASNESP